MEFKFCRGIAKSLSMECCNGVNSFRVVGKFVRGVGVAIVTKTVWKPFPSLTTIFSPCLVFTHRLFTPYAAYCQYFCAFCIRFSPIIFPFLLLPHLNPFCPFHNFFCGRGGVIFGNVRKDFGLEQLVTNSFASFANFANRTSSEHS
jgi:hypothetical protein